MAERVRAGARSRVVIWPVTSTTGPVTRPTTRQRVHCDTTLCGTAWASTSQYKFVSQRAGRGGRGAIRQEATCDTALRRHDTVLYEPQHGAQRAACAQPGPWVCALCTRPSFDSRHCFESLFMSTVYEVFKKNKNKNKNKIKFYLLHMI